MTKSRWLNAFVTAVLVAIMLCAGLVPLTASVSQSDTPIQLGAPVKRGRNDPTIERGLQTALETQGRANMFIMFDARPDLSPAYGMSWDERGEFVYQALRETAEQSQAEVRAWLDARNIPYQSFIIDNSIYVPNAKPNLAKDLTTFSEVSTMRLERNFPVPDVMQEPPQQITSVEWGVSQINADDAWGMGYTGQGIVVSNIDTGVRYTHDALANQYRGNLGGGSYNHTYSWYDPTGAYPGAPGDNHGHGTHTMGTIAGYDGGSNQIGVAPGAQWIACKGCTSVSCPGLYLNACADWILAPGGDPSMRPQVVNNSWGGCDYSDWYRAKVTAWRAAGIHPVFSAGNTSNCFYSSPFCGSIGTPSTYREATSVGATTSTDDIASFSLWGPSADPNAPNEIKPEVSAPGASIRSASRSEDSTYTTMSGTSMAAPHVSGALAVIWSACPYLVGDFDATEQLLKDEALKVAYATGCGNEGPGNIPNNAFGYGRIDVYAAVQACYDPDRPTPTPTPIVPTPTPTPIPPTPTPLPGVVFWDDFETDKGWTIDPSGSDTATTGRWERADPMQTSDIGVVYQLGETASGSYDLVTGGLAGTWVASYDVDNGVTSIRSPDITLPSGEEISLEFQYYLAHMTNATSDDYLRVKVVGSTTTTVFEELGSGDTDAAVWAYFETSLNAYAGQTVYLLIEAADDGSGSLIEAGIDDVYVRTSGIAPTPTDTPSPTDTPPPTDTPSPTDTPPPTDTPAPPTPPPGPGPLFFDDFETDKGWTTDPSGSDTATTGLWERANPESTSYNGTYQLGETASGSYDLVTGPLAGSTVGSYDIDGGVTSIRSPDVALPSDEDITLSFEYYLAHYSDATSDDYLRVKVVGAATTTVLEELGSGHTDEAAWETFETSLNAYAGETVYLLIEAADGGSGTLVEAGIDDVTITSSGVAPTPEPPTPTSESPTATATSEPPTATATSEPPTATATSEPPTATATPELPTPAPGSVFEDDFETDKGWTVDPSGTDTAKKGLWERANPESTWYNRAYQLGETTSGNYDLVTGPLAGSTVGSYDLDGGVTSIRSPDVALPSSGDITLSFEYYLAHYNNATSDDYLRVRVVGATTTTVFEELGSAEYDEAAWETFETSLNAFAGQTIYLLIEAADGGKGTLVEAAIDDVLIE